MHEHIITIDLAMPLEEEQSLICTATDRMNAGYSTSPWKPFRVQVDESKRNLGLTFSKMEISTWVPLAFKECLKEKQWEIIVEGTVKGIVCEHKDPSGAERNVEK